MSQFSSAWVGPDMTGVERGIKVIAGERFYRGHKIVQLFDIYPNLAKFYTGNLPFYAYLSYAIIVHYILRNDDIIASCNLSLRFREELQC